MPKNRVKRRFVQNPPDWWLVTQLAVAHFSFWKQSLVAGQTFSGKPHLAGST